MTRSSPSPTPPSSAPPGAKLWAEGEAVKIGGFSFEGTVEERIQTETNFCFGITEGPGVVEVEGATASATGPDIVRFHKPGDVLRSQPRTTSHVGSWVVFTDDPLSADIAPAFDKPFLRPSLKALARLRGLFSAARAGFQGRLWADESALAAIDAFIKPLIIDEPRRTPREKELRLVREADALLAGCYATPMSLSAVSRTLGVSSSYLARTYRTVAGMTVHARRERLRLAEAVRRLADGERNLSALAHDLGYSSHSHFSAAFIRSVGASPSDARSDMERAAVLKFDSANPSREA